VIQRKTQTETYWKEQFEVTAEDVALVYDLILDRAEPVVAAAIAREIITHHVRIEEEEVQAELLAGRPYEPQATYEVGEKVLFSALDFALGTVVGTRAGRNPNYGDFTVIQVEMENGDGVREFASALEGEHALNRPDGDASLLDTTGLLAVPDLVEAYGPLVEERLAASLGDKPEFVLYRDEWFLQDLLCEIHAGHLNIAEALIEIKGRPLPTAEFLPDLDLPAEIAEPIQVLSLERALEADGRFDNVGDSGRSVWYVRRLAPQFVVEPPARLALDVPAYDRGAIDQELLALEREIDDEGSDEEVLGPARQIYAATISLIYPHWRAGTLPLTVRTRGLFPQPTGHHAPVVLVDGQSGDRMQGWIVREESFVYGLEDWYGRHKLPAGAHIKLERTRDPRVINVDFQALRLKHLWVKVAAVQAGKLVFQMRKMPISCRFDEHLAISEDNPLPLDQLWEEANARGDSVYQIMLRVLPELIKLSPQGTVHAKTIYSAVNILKRVPPGPVFALLAAEPCFVPMAGGYWTFDEALATPQLR
jgi:hypothetical protein